MNNGEQFFNTSGAGYEIERSLRFNSADSAYLSRTPASAGNRKTWTWAGWVKRGGLGTDQPFFSTSDNYGSPSSANYFYMQFGSDDKMYVQQIYPTFNAALDFTPNGRVFRDPSAWYHVVLAIDTTQATGSDRQKMWINGELQTLINGTAGGPTTISQDYETTVNTANEHRIGRYTGYFNGYLADIHFIDGQALDPTSFGEFSATTGVWMPKKYTGTYGTNGFKLDFSDNSAATATTLGKDSSGNGNNWTPNNLSVTAGAGNDSLVDVPTNGSETDTGAGGQVRGNYATWNPLSTSRTLSNGNLYTEVNGGGGSNIPISASIALPASGKWYWEITAGGSAGGGNGGWDWGIVATSVPDFRLNNLVVGGTGGCYGVNGNDGNLRSNNTTAVSSYVSGGITGGDVAMVAYDAGAGKLWLGKNGTWGNNGGTGNPASGTNAGITGLSGEFMPVFEYASDSGLVSATANFGQRSFAYTAPSGFKALCTANLPAPTIEDGSTVMDIALYTGNGGTQTISGLGFSPDFVWIKDRAISRDHYLFDVIRDAGLLSSNNTNAESTGTDWIDYNSDGFTSKNGLSPSGDAHVAWCWDAGSSTVTNTAGSISSQVRANASAGFSIVTYTGNATTGATVGHGLGVAPGFVIIKDRGAASDWRVWLTTFGTGNALSLNSTAATSSNSPVMQAAPSSTVMSLLGSGYSVNNSGNTYVAYCFAPVAGYSSFGSYTGNGSADGPFVYTGFRPRWWMIKRTDTTSNWIIYDSERDLYNPEISFLLPNSSNAESVSTGNPQDFLSNGIKLRNTNADRNASGGTYIYAAFAEHPFQYARAR